MQRLERIRGKHLKEQICTCNKSPKDDPHSPYLPSTQTQKSIALRDRAQNSFLRYCILFQNSVSELENAQGRVAHHPNGTSKAKSTSNHKDIPKISQR